MHRSFCIGVMELPIRRDIEDNSRIIFPQQKDSLMFLNTGTSKSINFPFGTCKKLMVLGVPVHVL